MDVLANRWHITRFLLIEPRKERDAASITVPLFSLLFEGLKIWRLNKCALVGDFDAFLSYFD